MDIAIAIDDPAASDVGALLEQHLAFARAVTPAGHVHALDVEGLRDRAVTFFSARVAGVLLGIGALRELDKSEGELKSMYVSPTARGQGVGRAIVAHLLSVAADQGYDQVNIETGTMDAFAPARSLYTKMGFQSCEPFAGYTANPYSMCMSIVVAMTPTTGYAPVNGVDLYWESRGAGGTPLIVVHGGFGTTSMFGDLLDQLARDRRVVALELQGHGHTRDIPRPFSYESFGDDIDGVIEHLGLGRADLLGYSLGGSSCLRCAIQHPDRVRRLAVVSIACRRDGWFPGVLAGMDQVSSAGFDQMKQAPLYQAWLDVAPDRDAFPTLMDKMGDLLRHPYDWTEEVKRIETPTMLVFGDADSIAPSHAAEFFALLGGGLRDAGWDGSLPTEMRLAVLPGVSHYNIFGSPLLVSLVADFLA